VTVEANFEVIKTHTGLAVFAVTPDYEASLAHRAVAPRKHEHAGAIDKAINLRRGPRFQGLDLNLLNQKLFTQGSDHGINVSLDAADQIVRHAFRRAAGDYGQRLLSG
jgi:hypothetical protein